MFTLLDTTSFPERRLVAKRYRHDCGMEVISLEAQDPENLFVAYFPTDAADDTGSAHIIEHSVLEGSEKFPVKDPFVCLLKSSVATFLNACTYSDRTLYPFTTCCKQDYFNLLEVYWDAVFHPRLSRDVLGQEGWHYEIQGRGRSRKLTINGIVYNEMSGYYSDPGTIIGREMEKGLFPHTSLRYDSGGVPEKIPTLTYPAFLRFHQSHYNPTVARVVLYGDIPTEEKLAVLERHLQEDLPRLPKRLPLPKQPRRLSAPPAAPAVRKNSFVPDPESQRSKTGLVAMAWALDDTRDPDLDLGFQLLEAVLIGNAAAPLGKALLESRIGTAPMASGYDNETKHTSFCVSMRGVKPKDFPKFERLVLDTLRKCVQDGLPAKQVEGALTRFQTQNQEIGKDYVYDLLEDIIASWHYSDDPFLFLRQSTRLPHLQELLEKHPRYLEELIQKWLLDNPRRVLVELLPDDRLKKRTDDALKAKLSKLLATWTEEKIRKTIAFQKKLQANALRPDTPEALATIPRLRRSDLPSKVTPLSYSDGRFANGLRFRKSEDFTNGISRIALYLDGASLPSDLAQHLPLFAGIFPQVGTENKTYDQRAEEWALNGGAFALVSGSHTPDDAPAPVTHLLNLSLSSLDRNFPQAVELLKEQLRCISFGERRHLTELLRAAAAKASASLLRRGNFDYASARAADGLSPLSSYANHVAGFPAYQLLQTLARRDESQLDDLSEKFSRLAQWICTLPVVAVGLATEDAKAMKAMEELTSLWTPALEAKPALPLFASAPECTLVPGRREYGQIPAKVHTCVRAFAAPHLSSAQSMPLTLAANILTSGYLWDEIRAKGGAYGCKLHYRPGESLAYLHSHDDPNCENTYRAFDNLPAYLKEHPFSQEEVDKAILQTLSPFLVPVRPAAAATRCLDSLLRGITTAKQQERFDAYQAITREQVQKAAEDFFAQPHNDCALGPAPAPAAMALFPIGG